MKSVSLLLISSVLFLFSSCGISYRDVAGKWVFKDLKYYDTPQEKQMDAFEFDQTKDLFRGMTYHFQSEDKFTLIIPNLNDEEVTGTYSFDKGDEMVLKMKTDTKRYKVVSIKEREMVLRELDNKELEEKVDFVFTR